MSYFKKNTLIIWLIINFFILYYVLSSTPELEIHYFESQLLVGLAMTIISFPLGPLISYIFWTFLPINYINNYYFDTLLFWIPYFIGGTIQWFWLLPKFVHKKSSKKTDKD